jgi:hypothetical protein
MNKQLLLFAQHIALGTPNEVDQVAVKNGYKPAKNDESRVGFILRFVQEKGESAMDQLVKIHPDRQIILASSEKSNFSGEPEMPTTPTGTITKTIEKPSITNLALLFILGILLISILNK